MSVQFVATSSQYLSNASAIATSDRWWVIRFRIVGTSGSPNRGGPAYCCFNSGSNTNYIEIRINDGLFAVSRTCHIAVSTSAPSLATATTSNTWTVNTWHTILAYWRTGAPNEIGIQLDSGGWATNTTVGSSLSSPDTTEVGHNPGTAKFLTAALAEMSIGLYHFNLGGYTDPANSFIGGLSPLAFGAFNVGDSTEYGTLHHWRLANVNDLTDVHGSKNWTNNSATSNDLFPRVYYKRSKGRIVVPRAVAATRRVCIDGIVYTVAA